MKKIMTSIMLSCKSAGEYIEKRTVKPLSFSEGLQLRFHLIMCRSCKAYEKHSQALDEALSKWTSTDNSANVDAVLSPKIKSKIIERIRKEND